MTTRLKVEIKYLAYWLGILGYCQRCDHCGWTWPHRRHAPCWRGTAAGRAAVQDITRRLNGGT